MSLLDSIHRAFNASFLATHNTRLQGGAAEPYYSPNEAGSAMVYYREDFASSALHEIAHWCIAGITRRALEDYGYWYNPVRDLSAQSTFESVEVKPQALEWIFHVAAQVPFGVSADNLALPLHDTRVFRSAVRERAKDYLEQGLPQRAQKFAFTLAQGSSHFMDPLHYIELPR